MNTIKGVGLVQANIEEGYNLQIIHGGAWNEPPCFKDVDSSVLCFGAMSHFYHGTPHKCLFRYNNVDC